MFFEHFSRQRKHLPIRILLLVSLLSFCYKSFSDTNNHFSEHAHAQLMENAEQLYAEGRFTEAEIVFRQLFASIRANNGLFHEQQFAVLDRLIQLNLSNADWQSLKQHLDYHDWLLNRLYSDNALLLARYLQINARHHEQAAQAAVGPARNWHLVQTRQQLWRAVSALERLPGEGGQVSALLYKIAMLHYALSRQTDLRWLTSFEMRSDEPAMISGWAMQGGDIGKRSYEIGAELISRIVNYYDASPDINPAAQAAVMAQLFAYRGDWELLFGRERTAFSFYEQSLELTAISSCEYLMRALLFENLVQLPVETLTVDPDVCMNKRDNPVDTLATAEITLMQSDSYRPRWHQEQWLLSPSPAGLSTLNSENQYE